MDNRRTFLKKQEGIALESELARALKKYQVICYPGAVLQWQVVPGVLRNKWFEPRHIQHQIAR